MSNLALPLEEPVVPLTPGQWERVLAGHKFRILAKPERLEWAGRRAVHCMRCKNASDTAHQEPWRAWCLAHRVQVSNTFPKLCREHKA